MFEITHPLEELLLNRREIEGHLSTILPFKRLCIYHIEEEDLLKSSPWVYLPEEGKLFLPLKIKGETGCMLYLEGIGREVDNGVFSLLPRIVNLILENTELRRQSQRDMLCGAYNLYTFIQKIEYHIEEFVSLIGKTPSPLLPENGEIGGGESFLGAIKIRGIEEASTSLGLERIRSLLSRVYKVISSYLGGRGYIGFRPMETFYIYVRGGRGEWERSLSGLKTHLEKSIPWEEEILTPHISLTYLSYPKDLDGATLKLSPHKIALHLIAMCDQALQIMASTTPKLNFFPVKETIRWAGKVTRVMEDNALVINLGKEMGIRVGTYFGVIDRGKPIPVDREDLSLLLKGEVVVIHCKRGSSLAETLFLKDPRNPIREGDKLILLRDEEVCIHQLTLPTNPRCCLQMPQFINAFYTMCNHYKHFALLLIKDTRPHPATDVEGIVEGLCEKAVLMGRYGTEGYILLFPEINICRDHPLYLDLQQRLLSLPHLVAGISNYPCLNFSRYETISHARSALEHASLLSPPKIAIFDSITLTLKGDRAFLKGDILSAISEYKAALGLDRENLIARNSLGICYAHLGQMDKAIREFKRLISREENLTYLYNLASLYIKINNHEKAEKLLLKCLELDPSHLYTLIRLGKLCELKGDMEGAKKWYQKIFPSSYPPILRYLASLSIREGDISTAQEYLEEAITLNPMDAESIFMLGKIYLEHKQDKDTAISLIQKSVELRPDKIPYRQLLSSLDSSHNQKF